MTVGYETSSFLWVVFLFDGKGFRSLALLLYMSLNFQICHKEPVHNRKSIIGLFALDFYLGL